MDAKRSMIDRKDEWELTDEELDDTEGRYCVASRSQGCSMCRQPDGS